MTESSVSPTAELKSEHQTILRVIAVLQRLVARAKGGGGFESSALAQCVEFFRLFADACHHAKEEDLLFPALEESGIPREGGPIGVMLYEHKLARGYTKEMGDALSAKQAGEEDAESRFCDSANQYIDLLTQHIYKEDNILFNMGDRMLSKDDQASLCRRFCGVGCRAFDGKTREDLMRIADSLEAQWPS